MHSDSHFFIGGSHNVCQDYTMAGTTRTGKTYALLSDGCSGSANSDFGARLLCRAAKNYLDYSSSSPLSFQQVAVQANQMKTSIGLENMALDATLLCAIEVDGGVQASAAGDGLIVGRKRNGEYSTHLIDFHHSYPAYANYTLDEIRLNMYLEATGMTGSSGVRGVYAEDRAATQHDFFQTQVTDINEPTAAEGIRFNPYQVFFPSDSYDMVAIFSDGITSFQSKETGVVTPVPISLLLEELLDFKSTNGEFVLRRAKKFLQKTCTENRWTHFDDFSMAVVVM